MSVESNPSSQFGYFVSVRFRKGDKAYSFATNDATLAQGDLVIVETIDGCEAAIVGGAPHPMEHYRSPFELKPILRRANKTDIGRIHLNEAYEKRALEICADFIARLKLPMDLVDACYNLDGDKVTITYTSSEKRVDFRELLHFIVPALSCHVELRQLASRDRARLIGGLGLCGLPLCCSTFLTNFEGISISRAKNQMLTLNIPKISGPCGKLICCLTFEDEAYTEAKKEFPTHGTPIRTPEGDYMVDTFNILSRTVRLVNATRDDYKTYTLEDIRAMQKGTYKKKVEKKEDLDFLPNYDFQIKDRDAEEAKGDGKPKPGKENRGHGKDNRSKNQNRNQGHNNQNRNGQKPAGNGQKPNAPSNKDSRNKQRQEMNRGQNGNDGKGQRREQNRRDGKARPARHDNEQPRDSRGGRRHRDRRENREQKKETK